MKEWSEKTPKSSTQSITQDKHFVREDQNRRKQSSKPPKENKNKTKKTQVSRIKLQHEEFQSCLLDSA